MRKALPMMLPTRPPIRLAGPLVALAVLLAGTVLAAATGTLYCTIDDRNLTFDLHGNTSTDYGTIIGVQHGRLQLKPGRSVKTAAEFAVSKDNTVLKGRMSCDGD